MGNIQLTIDFQDRSRGHLEKMRYTLDWPFFGNQLVSFQFVSEISTNPGDKWP